MAVDALFRRGHLDDAIDIEFLLFVHQPVDLDLPRTRAEILRKFGGSILVRREFVVVVVMRHVVIWSYRFRSAQRTLLDTVDLVACQCRLVRRDHLANRTSRSGSHPRNRSTSQELATI